ncbi:MAG: MXAN_5187 C-terminal domain-containing protein [Myxococcota bacterium]
MAEDLAQSIRAENKRMEAELESLAQRLHDLRVQYDRYFMGLERIPPLRDRQALERDMRNSGLRKARRTALKFRFNNLRQSLATHARRWDRIMRLIEEGRFKRERNALSAHPTPPTPEAGSNGDGKRPGGERTQGKAGSNGRANGDARAVFESWRAAQRKVGRSAKVDFEKFRRKLEAQKRAQMKKYGWKDVNYSVRVKGDKVALVARPVKDDG